MRKKQNSRPDWDDGRTIASMDVDGMPRRGSARKQAQEDGEPEDDGRVIAPMNVDGMPWYTKGRPVEGATAGAGQGEPLSKKDTRRVIWVSVGIAVGIALIFIAAGALFILFCTKVWFRQ